MTDAIHAHEYEVEPVRGLPEALPAGEEILWQGSPDAWGLARRVFHVDKIAVYFAVLALWRGGAALSDGQGLATAVASASWLLALAAGALGVLAGLAWMHARATVYTITSERVVLRFGLAFVLAFNLPFRQIQSAALRTHTDGTGDLPLDVTGAGRFGYVMLWPHARPWRFGKRVQPMLRAVPQAARVAGILAEALRTSVPRPAAVPETPTPRSVAAAAS